MEKLRQGGGTEELMIAEGGLPEVCQSSSRWCHRGEGGGVLRRSGDAARGLAWVEMATMNGGGGSMIGEEKKMG